MLTWNCAQTLWEVCELHLVTKYAAARKYIGWFVEYGGVIYVLLLPLICHHRCNHLMLPHREHVQI